MPNGPKPEGQVAVMHYFGMRVTDFKREWSELSETDKAQLKTGVGALDAAGNPAGTLTY